MSRFRNIATCLVAASAIVGLAGCSALGIGGSNQQAAATPPPAPAPAPAPAPPPPAPAVNPMAPSTLREVQTTLKQDGLYTGRVDGRWGPRTEHAVMAFQQKNGLQASGQLDQPTLSALNIGGGSSSMNSGSMGSSGGAPMGSSSAPGGAPASGTTTNP